MNKQKGSALAGLIAALICFGIVFGLSYWASSSSCKAQWSDSGFGVRYGFMSGCMIHLPDGRWIPADNYREVK